MSRVLSRKVLCISDTSIVDPVVTSSGHFIKWHSFVLDLFMFTWVLSHSVQTALIHADTNIHQIRTFDQLMTDILDDIDDAISNLFPVTKETNGYEIIRNCLIISCI
jgi:uncharacterized membrane protein